MVQDKLRKAPTTRKRRGRVARLWRYVVIRLTRLSASPHEVALGFAAGAAISVTPLIGLHIVLAVLLAFLTRGALLGAVLGTFIGNPITFPVFFGASYWIGDRLRGWLHPGPVPGSEDWTNLGLDEEDEAEAAADLVLEASDDLFSDSWLLGNLESIWPVFSTMLIGSLPVAAAVYATAYFAMRAAVSAMMGTRRRGLGANR